MISFSHYILGLDSVKGFFPFSTSVPGGLKLHGLVLYLLCCSHSVHSKDHYAMISTLEKTQFLDSEVPELFHLDALAFIFKPKHFRSSSGSTSEPENKIQ